MYAAVTLADAFGEARLQGGHALAQAALAQQPADRHLVVDDGLRCALLKPQRAVVRNACSDLFDPTRLARGGVFLHDQRLCRVRDRDAAVRNLHLCQRSRERAGKDLPLVIRVIPLTSIWQNRDSSVCGIFEISLRSQ